MDKGSGNENDDQIIAERIETDIEIEPLKTTTRSGSQSPPSAPSSSDTVVSETASGSPRLVKQQQHAISESAVVPAAATACS